jgi:hypothetical protein
MIALQQRERWAPEHAVRHEEIVFREVEYKAVRLFRTSAPHLWPTQMLSVASEGQRSARNSTKSAMFR